MLHEPEHDRMAHRDLPLDSLLKREHAGADHPFSAASRRSRSPRSPVAHTPAVTRAPSARPAARPRPGA
eukprot:12037959-Alexandrium_andersonii.AAC.1